MADAAVDADLESFSSAVRKGPLKKSQKALPAALAKVWSELKVAAKSSPSQEALVTPFGEFTRSVCEALLLVPSVGKDHYAWLELAEPCFAAAVHAGDFVGQVTSKEAGALLGEELRGVLVEFLERVEELYDQLLIYAEEAEWLEWGSSGLLRLHMVRLLFVAFGTEEASRALLGGGGLLKLAGGDVQTAVSLAGFLLWCDEAPFDVQLVAANGMAQLTTADAAFLGAACDEGEAPSWEDPTADIKKLTNMLNRHVNGLIEALIDHEVLDSFAVCYRRHGQMPAKVAPVVRALLNTIHNSLLYCSQNQKRLRTHVAMHADLVPSILIPYLEASVLPALEAQPSLAQAPSEWQFLEAALQAFVVVTFNIGVLRERFRRTDLVPRVLVVCRAAGLLGHVKWLELLVKLSVNVELPPSSWPLVGQELVKAAAGLEPAVAARLSRRLAAGGAALPMNRSSPEAAKALAPLFGSTAKEVPGGSRGAAKKGGKKGKKGRRRKWVPVQLTLQAGSGQEGEALAASDEEEDEEEPGGEPLPVAGEALASEEAPATQDQQEQQAPSEATQPAADAPGEPEQDVTCALTGALLHDPVETPAGLHYNRADLEQWVEAHGPVEPVTGAPLDLSECREATELQEAACMAQMRAISENAVAHLRERAVEERAVEAASTSEAQATSGVGDGAPARPAMRGDLPPLVKPKKTSRKAHRAVHISCTALSQVPSHLRCAIDGKMMSNPVRSPYGHVFEQKSLERWVSVCGSVCPVTSKPLRLDDCQADAEVRAQIKQFLREKRSEASGGGPES